MKRGWLVVVLLLSLGANLGLIGAAVARRRLLDWGWGPGRGVERPFDRPGDRFPDRPADRREGHVDERIADRLGLDAEQRQRFLVAQRRMFERIGAARREIVQARGELRYEVAAPAPDRARIDELLGELSASEAAINRAFVDGILEARSELDPRQSREFLHLMAERALERSGGEPPPLRRRLGGGRGPFAPAPRSGDGEARPDATPEPPPGP